MHIHSEKKNQISSCIDHEKSQISHIRFSDQHVEMSSVLLRSVVTSRSKNQLLRLSREFQSGPALFFYIFVCFFILCTFRVHFCT